MNVIVIIVIIIITNISVIFSCRMPSFEKLKAKFLLCQFFGSETRFLTPKEEQKYSTYKNKMLRNLEHKTKHRDTNKFA
jgi:hypothetical protein